MDNQNDPLNVLLADDVKSVDRSKIAQLLKPFVVFDKETQQMNFLDEFRSLDNKKKIEVVLLAEKARSLIFRDGDTEGLSASEIINMESMPTGSVKTSLKALFDKRQILKNKEGKYYLPNYRVQNVLISN